LKLLIILPFLVLSSVALACTDFTGTYRDLENASEVQIIQTKCTSVTTISDGATVVMAIDGKFNILSYEEPVTVLYRAVFESNNLVIDFRIHLDLSDVSTDQVSNVVFSLDSNNDLLTVTTQPDGTVVTLRQTRIN
jgi:hypothetical protein